MEERAFAVASGKGAALSPTLTCTFCHQLTGGLKDKMKPVSIQQKSQEPNTLLILRRYSPNMLLVYTVIFPNRKPKASFTSATKWHSCSPKTP